MNNKKIKIGILGGSFNPPHLGHLFISEQAIKKLGLKQVWWMVSPQNPLKQANIKDSFMQRIELCEDFTKDHPQIKIKDLESRLFKYNKKFYSYDLLKRLNAKFKDHEFYFIIGADNLTQFHKWYKFKELSKLAKIVAFERPGYKASNSKAAIIGIEHQFISGKTVAISSTELRKIK